MFTDDFLLRARSRLRSQAACGCRFLVGLTFGLGLAATLHAAVSCPVVFGDHMVLQREQPVPVWGAADPGESVTVSFAGQIKSTTTGADGRWRITLDALTASSEPREFTVAGAANVLRFADVLVGEVWFCSGQSNMEKGLAPNRGQHPVDNYELEIAAARYPRLRLFQVPRPDRPQEGTTVLHWLSCTPATVAASQFSAAAYFFGQQIHQTLDVPVGLIHSSYGGTAIDAWLPESAFTGSLAGLDAAWLKQSRATEMFHRMVEPFAPCAIRGFLWYQGENNIGRGDIALYGAKQTALIAAWRQAWALPDAPFFGVLLAPMAYAIGSQRPVNANALPMFWLEQIRALSAPHTGYVVTTDLVSDFHDIHPTDKRDVGLRLARLALAETYGRDEIEAHGPTLVDSQVAGSEIVLTFAHAEQLRSRDGQALTDFLIADRRRVFLPAVARIQGNQVVVCRDDMTEPLAVRFAWNETAHPNLINAAGLPTVPFRTDDWPESYLRTLPAGH